MTGQSLIERVRDAIGSPRPETGLPLRFTMQVDAAEMVTLDVILSAFAPAPELVHACPLGGESLTQCCGQSPFELPRTDRLTSLLGQITCPAFAMSRQSPAHAVTVAMIAAGWRQPAVSR